MTRITLSKIIIDLLKKHHLLSAPDILELLEKNGLKYNKTSIYRALDKLFVNEKVCRHSMGSNQIVYALRCIGKAHLVCLCCGKVQTAPIPVTCQFDKYQTPNFTPDHQHATIFGRCHNCGHEEKPKKIIDLHLV